MSILKWLFGGHTKPTASTAVTAKSTTTVAKKKTKKIATKGEYKQRVALKNESELQRISREEEVVLVWQNMKIKTRQQIKTK